MVTVCLVEEKMKDFERFLGGIKATEGQQTNVEQCADRSASVDPVEEGWYCTASAGHAGKHLAGNGFDQVYAAWEDE